MGPSQLFIKWTVVGRECVWRGIGVFNWGREELML